MWRLNGTLLNNYWADEEIKSIRCDVWKLLLNFYPQERPLWEKTDMLLHKDYLTFLSDFFPVYQVFCPFLKNCTILFFLNLNVIWECKAHISFNCQWRRPAGTINKKRRILTLREDVLICLVHKKSRASPIIRVSETRFTMWLITEVESRIRPGLHLVCGSKSFSRACLGLQACNFPLLQ